MSEGARHILAIEKDARCLPVLEEIASAYPGRLKFLNADALEIDPVAHLQAPIRVVANLPYNVGTELLVRWLTPPDWPPFWESLTLMFQREVADAEAEMTTAPGEDVDRRLEAASRAHFKDAAPALPEAEDDDEAYSQRLRNAIEGQIWVKKR